MNVVAIGLRLGRMFQMRAESTVAPGIDNLRAGKGVAMRFKSRYLASYVHLYASI
jgi:hypothetical protein